MYIWQQFDWPHFTWDEQELTSLLAHVSREQGRLLGKLQATGFKLRNEAHLNILTQEIVKSNEIEGVLLKSEQVRSSIARHMGLPIGGLVPSDRNVDGMVDLMLDATSQYNHPLTVERLFKWHTSMFPTGRTIMRDIKQGKWRDDKKGPMQVVSGPIGREKVHFEAPPARRIPQEMKKFLNWFKQPGDTDPLLVAGLAHLWFVTIHPFDDGNGRIARAIADMALTRADKTEQRFYSMSAQIRLERKHYYEILEQTQKGKLNITRWQIWFLNLLLRSIEATESILSRVLAKAQFWERFAKMPLNPRQIKVLNKLLDGFEGNLTTSKWAKIAKCSQDSAYRDILDLLHRGILKKSSTGGRSTNYWLDIE